MKLTRADFPDSFLFGTATSATQIEGSAFGGAGLSHWDTFAMTPGNVARGDGPGRACDHHHLWEADLDLVAGAGFGAYRFSVNWARVLPDGTGALNAEGLDFYDRLVDGLCARGLKPFLTLYHWDLPSALALRGGWTNRDIAGWFADYALVVWRRIGDRLAAAATINEPWCVAWLSHFLGAHAPGLRDIRAAGHAMHHVLLAHGAALHALRAQGARNLGIVLNFEHVAPYAQTDADAAAAEVEDALLNRWFVEAITRAAYPEPALAGLEPHLPRGWQDDMARIAAPLDWLGVNYYRRALKAQDPGALWPAAQEIAGPLPRTTMGWEIYPEGLEALLLRLHAETGGRLPLHVTENGMSCDDRIVAGAVEDGGRIGYIDAHLAALRRAMARGADVRSYFYWSLLDNFEWALGYEKRFGLVHVDFDSLKRTPKRSYHALAQFLSQSARSESRP